MRQAAAQDAQAAGPQLETGTCQQCSAGSHACFACGSSASGGGSAPAGAAAEQQQQQQQQQQAVVKCGMGMCGRWYHSGCALALPLTRAASCGFRCALHYCAACSLSGDGVVMVQCIRCPVGYHARCKPPGARQLSRRFIVCPKHAAA